MNKIALAGGIGAIGLVIQIILGFALAGSGNPHGSGLVVPHLVIGIAGLALVIYLVATIFRTPSTMVPRVVFALALVFTLSQVLLGFALLNAPSSGVLMAHQGIAIVILILLALGGMMSARDRRKMKMPKTTGVSP